MDLSELVLLAVTSPEHWLGGNKQLEKVVN